MSLVAPQGSHKFAMIGGAVAMALGPAVYGLLIRKRFGRIL